MSGLLRISEAASMGLHAVALMAARPEGRFPVADIAGRLEVSASHLSKVLQRLVRAGLLHSLRGVGGGFAFIREPEELTVMQVFEAIEGPMPRKLCLLRRPFCDGSQCILGDLLYRVDQLAYEKFNNTTIAEMGKVFAGAG